MRKLRYAIVLPVAQVLVAAELLHIGGPPKSYVATSRLICWGLNAPALLLRIPAGWGPLFELLPSSIFGIDTSDVFFLIGIILVWYFVGRELDRQRVPPTTARTSTVLILHAFLIALGAFLFYLGLRDFQNPTFENLAHRPYRGMLTLLWSCTLLFLSGNALLGTIRRVRH